MPEQQSEGQKAAPRGRRKPTEASASAKTSTTPARTPRRFSPASGTAPTADETLPPPARKTPVRPETKTPVRPDVKDSKEDDRVAFTWRLTPPKVSQHDQLMFRIRQELQQPRLDKATVLDTLVGLVESNPSVYKALITRLKTGG